jgi:hypothetical protein
MRHRRQPVIDPETSSAVHALMASYWQRVDRIASEPVDELYVESGVMHIGSLRCAGRDAIRAFFLDRNSKEVDTGRTTRHLPGGLSIKAIDDSRYRVRSTVQVLSGHGEWPMASAPPSSVGDFDDVVLRSPDGAWLFESRTCRIVFTGLGAASFAR